MKKVRFLLLACALLGLPNAFAGGAGAVTSTKPVTPIQSAKAATYTNPILDENVPDPFVLHANGQYYAYVTNGPGGNVPLYVSNDLVHWTSSGDALPDEASWARLGFTWAPEVMAFASNRYVLYYTTRDTLSDRQCVGAAVSERPEGPFTDRSERPIVCQADLGGSIDASPFQDADGQRYLLWKNDGNCCNLLTTLYLQPLSQDGLSLLGEPQALIYNDALWEGAVVEAPTLHLEDGVYYLLYSGANYNDDTYAVGYATSQRLIGPYRKAEDNPIVVTTGAVVGPGHQSLIKDAAGQQWLIYHAWTLGAVGDGIGMRNLRLDKISFKGGKVTFDGPTLTPQPAPSVKP